MTSPAKRGFAALMAAILLICMTAVGLCETTDDAVAEEQPAAVQEERSFQEPEPKEDNDAQAPEAAPEPDHSDDGPTEPDPEAGNDAQTPEPDTRTPEPDPTQSAHPTADPQSCSHASLTPNMSSRQTFRRISEFEHQRVEVTVSYDICNLCGAELNRHETETVRSPESHTWGESRFVYDTLESSSDETHDRVVHQRSVRECTLCGYVQGETVSEVSRTSEPHSFASDSTPFERTENPTETTHEVVRGTSVFQRCECGFSKERAEKVTYRMVEPHEWEIHTYRATKIESPTETGHDVVAYEIAYWQCGVCGYTTDYVATEISRTTVPHTAPVSEARQCQVFDENGNPVHVVESFDVCPDCGQVIAGSMTQMDVAGNE